MDRYEIDITGEPYRHSEGDYYLADEVDKRIADLEGDCQDKNAYAVQQNKTIRRQAERIAELEAEKADAVKALQHVWYDGDVDWAGNYLRDTDQMNDPHDEEQDDE